MFAVYDQIWTAIREDFSDLRDVVVLTRVLLRLMLAALLGGILGWEREVKGKTAGMRTHMLVAIGAALFVLIPQQAHFDNAEQSRVLQGLIAGVGFIGAGAILHNREEKGGVKGLTTATGLWLTAAIGVAAGMGRETLAVLSTLLSWAILAALPRIMHRFDGPKDGSDK